MEFMDSWFLLHENTLHLKTVYDHHQTVISSVPVGQNFGVVHPMVDDSVEMESVELSGRGGDGEDEDLLYRHSAWVMCVLIAGYLFVLCFGLLGNFSVLIVVARTPRMSTVTNLFICNLALADLLVLIFCILPNLVSNIFVRKSTKSFFRGACVQFPLRVGNTSTTD